MIKRREFIKQGAGLLALSAFTPFNNNINSNYFNPYDMPKRILPRKLKKGDTIGLVTPAAPIDEEQLNETIGKLEKIGFKTYHTPTILKGYGYFAGTDQERADDLMHMFKNKKVDGIMCVRGGYGTSRIVDLLDFEAIKNNPKVFIGYSDITFLHVSIFQKTGLVTYHGPVGVSEFNDFTLHSLNRVVMEPAKVYEYPYQREKETKDNPEFDLYTITSGEAEGYLTGGNLSLLVSMLGTEYEPDFEDKIVFIEEVDEKTYRIDKMLVQLIMGSNFKKAKAIVFGVCKNCDENEDPSLTLKQAITGLIEPLNIPSSYGLSFGHINTKFTIPMGIKAAFNADTNTFKLLEKTVK